MGTWNSNPGHVAFPFASQPTEPARLFVHGISNDHYMEKTQMPIVQRANFQMDKWGGATQSFFFLSPLVKVPDFYLQTKVCSYSLCKFSKSHTGTINQN